LNTNCLDGFCCPNCGSSNAFRISARCWAEVHDDGIHDSYEFEWDDDAPCICVDCAYSGTVGEFTTETQKPTNRWSDVEVVHEVGDHRWVIEWEWIGEGNFGDYDEKDPNDMPRLRANLKVDGRMVRDGSYCTLASIYTPRTELETSAMELLLAVSTLSSGPVLFDGEIQVEGTKNVMQKWTWKEYTHGVFGKDPEGKAQAKGHAGKGEAGGEEGGDHGDR